MKKYILLATIAVSSLHADDRNEYYDSLLAKAGATPAGKTVEKTTSRDEYYNSLFAKTQTNGPGTSKSAIKKQPKGPEPSTDAIYNAYPNQGPGFYRYVERINGRRNYYLGRSRSIAAK